MKKKMAKRVGVRELKNSLSAHLRDVKAGATVMVTEHNSVIAELRPCQDASHSNPVLAMWIEQGVAIAAQRAKSPLAKSALSLPDGTAQAIIDDERGD